MTPQQPHRSAYLVAVTILISLASSLLFSGPTLGQSLTCENLEELFGFTLNDYPVEHQHGAILNIDVTYRLTTTEAIDASIYPDFVPIAEVVDQFITDYPNETDYWEILNKQLAQFLLDSYPQISGVSSQITVMPSPAIPYERFSAVTINRPNQCPLD